MLFTVQKKEEQIMWEMRQREVGRSNDRCENTTERNRRPERSTYDHEEQTKMSNRWTKELTKFEESLEGR